MSNPINFAVQKDKYLAGSMPEIFQLVDLVEKKLRQIQRETIKETGLTPAQYFILGLLGEKDGRPLKELAAACFCTRPTITGIVDSLEEKGLVLRAPNPVDRRSLLVKLTEAGRTLEHSTPTLSRVFHNCCTGLAPEEAQELSRLLRKLDQSLDCCL